MNVATPLSHDGRDPVASCFRQSLTEHRLPHAVETHEIIPLAGGDGVLVSQREPSQLVKVRLDPDTGTLGEPTGYRLGSAASGAHGLAVGHSPSTRGRVWLTQEYIDTVLLIDPAGDDPAHEPTVVRQLPLPPNARGPHYVGEYGDDLWLSLKGNNRVLRLNHTDPTDYTLYPGLDVPIFVARHPATGHFYATQDRENHLMWIDPDEGAVRQIPVPAEQGTTPVGMVAGHGAVWVALLGDARTGTGVFGRIDGEDRVTWFRLSGEGLQASLLHLAFDPPHQPACTCGTDTTEQIRLWLLSSSLLSQKADDAIFEVVIQDDRVISQKRHLLPTQRCMAHRLLRLPGSVLATQMHTASVAQLIVG
ncbi:hypothetical protein ACFY78_10640 [Streptomyces olindensis]|uniref:Vgb family protein n=1 Tax=Streptomyces olindensis TaxID=358823 RepID=UPI0036B11765